VPIRYTFILSSVRYRLTFVGVAMGAEDDQLIESFGRIADFEPYGPNLLSSGPSPLRRAGKRREERGRKRPEERKKEGASGPF
jgi:hypothetical protein